MDLLIDLNQIGQTLLIVTHDPHLATRCAGRLLEMADGHVARDRTLDGGAQNADAQDPDAQTRHPGPRRAGRRHPRRQHP
ncbi:hypothetical protein OTB20_18685 [Streptomyces sp. H27-H1]|uniref:hypothetical protein n=1 Tax=Streptomyces sp. H27-H1 TaxID=2996461 RepID=UPI002270E9B7|nr:hypothetical protein [Streptomyces sp. H27-H1]MCY0928185.1 hypothetical protein [Streptomyces sp. H27-H1]